ncbi:MAG: WxL domain-containing protein, partial [Acidimicrobiales bacterium]
ITVYGPPSITSSATSTTFSKGYAGFFTFAASGTPAPSFSESGALPTGVTLSSAGVLAGTPREAGVFGVTVTASNGVSPDATQSFTLDVLGSPSFTSPASADFESGSSSSFTVATSADPTATLAHVGALPTGLAYTDDGNGTATISGTATGPAGNYTLDLTASNSYGSASQQLVISVTSGTASTSGTVVTTGTGNAAGTLDAGTLSFTSTPANLTFPAISLDGSNQTTSAKLPVDIADATGSGTGWNVTITSTQFSSGSAALPSSATSVNAAPSAVCDSGASCTPATLSSSVTYPVTIPAGSTAPTATRLYSAAVGSGMGDQTISPTFTLGVPANSAAGAYSSNWTLSLVSGP